MKYIGLKKEMVRVVPHQNAWHINFQKEKNLILSLNNKHIKGVEHVGSTSVEGMPAKPIIDIAIGIDTYYNRSKLVKGLAGIGYEFKFEPRRYQSLFIKMDKGKDTHYLKIIRYKGVWWNEYMQFRKVLLTNRKFFEAYKNLKLNLGEKFLDNRKAYTKSKSDFIKKILKP